MELPSVTVQRTDNGLCVEEPLGPVTRYQTVGVNTQNRLLLGTALYQPYPGALFYAPHTY